MVTRIESDMLGPIAVPAEAWYGAHTTRAVHIFPITRDEQKRLGDYPLLVQALVRCKQAAAKVNGRLGYLTDDVTQAIVTAGDEVLAAYDPDQFPIHSLHGGGGTSANMNTNEVLANLAERILGGQFGEYQHVHANDHVNRHQSTNDVYPTACRLAILTAWPQLRDAWHGFIAAIDERGQRFADQRRIARTCLQDALPITFGDFLSGYAGFGRRQVTNMDVTIRSLTELTLGGTAVGRVTDVPADYFDGVISAVNAYYPTLSLSRAANLFDGFQNPDDLVRVIVELEVQSRGLIKIARDLRLLCSGPDAGFGEIRLPEVMAGSSMMPGKINPVVPEFAIQCGMRVVGHAAAAKMAIDHGELDLNIWESMVVTATLESMAILGGAVEALTGCIAGLEPVAEVNDRHAAGTIPLLTEAMKIHGYKRVSNLWKDARGDTEIFRRSLEGVSTD